MGSLRRVLLRLRAGAVAHSFWPRTRIRRPLDVARLVAAAAALAALVLLAVVDPGVLRNIASLVPSPARGVLRSALSAVNVIASLAVLAVLLAIAVDALRIRRFALTSALGAWILGVPGGLVIALLTGVAAGHGVTRLLIGPPDDSAGLPVTAAVALVVGADLQRRRRWLGPAQLAIAAAVACALPLGSLTLPSAAYAVLTGTTAGLAFRVAFGVVPARPSDDLVLSVLARAGWPVCSLHSVQEAAGRVRYAGVRPDDADLRITVVDRDRRGVTLARRAWRLLRLRTAAVGRPALSLRGQLERQALSAALAGSAGVPTARVLALLPAGRALVLVEQPLKGTSLGKAQGRAVEDGAVNAFRTLRRLHDAGLAHGAVTPDAVVLLPDGAAGFADLVAAEPASTDLQRELDAVALLVAVATRVGASHAVSALRAGYGTTSATEPRIAALLQPLALPRRVRRAVRGTSLLEELRAAVTGRVPGTPVAAPPRLERVSVRTLVAVAGGTAAAYVLASQLSKVSITSVLSSARPAWLAVALLASALTYVGSALTRRAFFPGALPLARTAAVQLASSFLTLVTPPTVGHVGLNIRYLQRAGVPTATAAATVAVSEGVTIAVTVLVLVICGWISGASSSRLALLPSGKVLAVLGVAAAVLAVVAATPPARRHLRRRIEPLIRRTLPQLLATTTHPRRLGTAVLGVLVLNGGYVLALDASLRAFSTSLALPTLVVVYFAASALGSAAPTPGGLGAVEAALFGGLTTAGIPVASALAAVLVFRAATFWLPAPLGWVAFVALQRRQLI